MTAPHLPQSSARFRADVERFAFAGAIAFPDLVEESGLKPEHFATEIIGQAWEAIPRCGRTTDDRLSVVEVAARAGLAAEALRPVLQAQVFTADQARTWWRKALDLAKAEAVVAAVRAVLAKPRPETDATGTLTAELEQVVRSFADQDDDGEAPTLLEVTEEYVRERCAELRHGRRRGVETGLRILDVWAGGLNAGELTTAVAAGGVGKSTFAMHVARQVARGGSVVLYFSAEMTSRQVGQREAHGAMARPISDRSVTAVDLEGGLEELKNDGHGDRIRLVYSSRMTASRLLAAARRVQHREGLGLVIFDHLGCFDVERPRASEQEQMAMAVNSCKEIAKILDVPFLLVTHLNRQGLIRGSERVRDFSDNVLELKRDGDNAGAHTEARLLKARQTGETHKAMLLSYSLKWQKFLEVDEITPTASPAPGGAGWGRGGAAAAGGGPQW